MKLTNLSLLVLTTLTLGTLTLRAEDTTTTEHRGEGFRKKLLEKFDTNHDGKLDETEKAAAKAAMQAHHQKMLEKFDTNKDGKLEPDERKAAREARKTFHQKTQGKTNA